ncbi:spermatogenesis-associated protein 2-like protein [Emydura macquarii macquarii]|uniref:spermatogenesis-associated protein 2-like protein n=1 Tax=Emydura macquarii macquarii TaxID=1129001 RepID=UPI00352AAE04
MGPGWAVQQEYRRCLERDFRRGHAGVCADPPLRESLQQRLLEDPQLHGALQSDVFATLARSLRGADDLPVALRGLAGAFEVLERAAVNLHLLPWRKEFGTIKTFSGVYVHSLQAALSDPDIAKSFRSMGYVQRDDHHFVLSRLPPEAELVQAACGFFAARVECEILEEILQRLGPCRVSAEDLIQLRMGTRDLDDCVEKLQRLTSWPQDKEAGATTAPGCADSIDLYRGALESPEAVNLYSEPTGAVLQSSPWGRTPQWLLRPPSWEQSPKPWREAADVPYPEALRENEGRIWDKLGANESGQEQPYRNRTEPQPAAFSFISLRRELSRVSDSVCPEVVGSPPRSSPSDSAGLKPHGDASWLMPRSAGEAVPAECSAAGLWPQAAENARGLPPAAPRLESSTWNVPQPPCYQLHSCLGRGALPSYSCSTCCLLHARGCAALQTCRSSHRMQELQCETQQRMWLQKAEVDMLLQEGAGPASSYHAASPLPANALGHANHTLPLGEAAGVAPCHPVLF